jgi:hypothetical protein
MPRRSRPLAVLGALGFAATLVIAPAGPSAAPAEARAPRSRLATHETHLRPAGRVVLRELARRTSLARAIAAPAPRERLTWDRGRHGTGAISNGDMALAAVVVGSATTGLAAAGPPQAEAALAPDLPAVSAAEGSPPAAALSPEAAGGPGVVGTAWNGLTDQAISCGSSRPCLEPPDPWVAVSAKYVVQMVNQSTRITDRSGGGAVQVSNKDFFRTYAWSTTAFVADPHVLFDPGHGRWIATLFAGTCSGGALFVAVSTSDDPTGLWDKYYLEFSGAWPDFPTLGYSAALVAVGVNEFAVSCGTGGSYSIGDYLGASLHVMDWADLLDGGGMPAIASTTPAPTAFSYVPAAGLSAGDAIQAAVALDDGTTTTADLGYLSVSGTVAGETLAVAAPVVLTPLGVAKLKNPPTPKDAGGLIGVQRNALDLRPTDAVWRNGRLAIASTTSCLRGSSYRPCGRVTELTTQADLSAPTLRQDLLLAPTSGYTDTFTPGVGYSDDGTLWTVFSQCSASRYVSSWARRQVPATTPGAWSSGAALIAAGRGPYGGTAGAGLNERWGDYVGVARDPAQAGSVWQANQIADTGGGWATRVARLGDDTTPPTISAPSYSFAAGTRAGTASVPVKISWSQSDGGSGVGTVRLERSVNGGAFAAVTLSSSTATEVILNLAYGTRYAFRLTATDNALNSAGWSDGKSFTPGLYSQSSSLITYRGQWRTALSSLYLGGSVRYADVAGRRATITVTCLAIAWVSTAAKTRGSARVYVDRVLQGTYSTYRSATITRRIITGRAYATSGAHRFVIEVVGTAHHPRVDLDAIVVLR